MDDVPLEISIEELRRMREEGEAHTLLDIREPHELEISALSGSLDIPMGSVPDRLNELPEEGTIAVLCRTGNRSMKVTSGCASRATGAPPMWAAESTPGPNGSTRPCRSIERVEEPSYRTASTRATSGT